MAHQTRVPGPRNSFALAALPRSKRAAERAGFEPAEEREPLAGLANRCLGPLDYLSRRHSTGSRSWEQQPCRLRSGGGGIRTREALRACRFSRPVVSSAHPPLRRSIIPAVTAAQMPSHHERVRAVHELVWPTCGLDSTANYAFVTQWSLRRGGGRRRTGRRADPA